MGVSRIEENADTVKAPSKSFSDWESGKPKFNAEGRGNKTGKKVYFVFLFVVISRFTLLVN